MSTIEEQLRDRLAIHLQEAPDLIDTIMADVEVAQVLARREARAQTWREAADVYGVPPERRIHCDAAEAYPLPKRTRTELREEPVPDQYGMVAAPLFRVRGGVLEHTRGSDNVWQPAPIPPVDFALMRHALDLHDNPWRIVEVEPDESNPWPEVEK